MLTYLALQLISCRAIIIMIHFVALQLMVHLVLIEIDMLCAALARTHHLQEKIGAWDISSAVLQNWRVTHVEQTEEQDVSTFPFLLRTLNSDVLWLAATIWF